MEQGVQVLGLVAGGFTAIAMVPQVVKCYRTRKAGDVSYGMYIVYLIGFTLWIIYGAMKSDVPIIATNVISIILSCIMLFFKFRFKE
ncbi:MAG: SemiSWEET transporter [Chitinophagales bacterium]|nr:SemiSWEET transporter [Chitinophagales bacterium]